MNSMLLHFWRNLTIIFLVPFTISAPTSSKGTDMSINIHLAMNQSNSVTYQQNDIDVYLMGSELVLLAQFSNPKQSTLIIDDPLTSQQSLLHFKNCANDEETIVELNPASIDIMGETTAPESADIQLGFEQSTTMEIDLQKYIAEDTFLPGKYQAMVQYLDNESNVYTYVIEYNTKAKLKLIEMAVDETEVLTLRTLALEYLMLHENGPEIELPKRNETPNEVISRSNNNMLIVKSFLEKR